MEQLQILQTPVHAFWFERVYRPYGSGRVYEVERRAKEAG